MSISPACLRVRTSSACASEARSGCDFLFACSEATTHQCSKSLAENAFRLLTSTTFTKGVWRFSHYNNGNLSCSSSAEVCHVHSRSLEAGRSSVGIAERDDILWFRCIIGASRKGPLRSGCDHHAAPLGENGCCARGATT